MSRMLAKLREIEVNDFFTHMGEPYARINVTQVENHGLKFVPTAVNLLAGTLHNIDLNTIVTEGHDSSFNGRLRIVKVMGQRVASLHSLYRNPFDNGKVITGVGLEGYRCYLHDRLPAVEMRAIDADDFVRVPNRYWDTILSVHSGGRQSEKRDAVAA